MKWLCTLMLVAVIAVVGGTRPAAAGTSTVMFQWERWAYPDSCVNPSLVQQGQANFLVNAVPIPTFTVGIWNNPDGTALGKHEAPFNTSLFRVGSNQLRFSAFNSNGTPECNHTLDQIWLSGLSPQPKVLWDLLSQGSDVDSQVNYSATLGEIDPELAKAIAKLRMDIDAEIARLASLGPNADNAARDITRLQALLAAIDELLERGFDQITLEELDALLADFADLLPGLYDDLAAIVQGFKQVIADLRTEIERISNEFRDWTTEMTDYGGGFNGSDFESPSGEPLPDVDVPSVLGNDPWRPDRDIYDHYADEVIASLRTRLDSAQTHVVDRAGFVVILGAWRQNIRAIDVALKSKAIVNQAEYGAFLQSQNKVLGFVALFMDREGWFKDTRVDPEIRQLIDTALHDRDAPRAERMKAALNVMTALDSTQASVVFTWVFMLKELGDAAQQARIERLRAQYAAKEAGMWDKVTGFLERAASVGWEVAVAVTPLGDVIDACELITGKEGCHLISGRNLSWKERAFSGVGLFMWGSSATYRRLADKAELIKCRPHLVAFGPIYSLNCSVRTFVNKLDDAIENVKKERPRQNLAFEPDVDLDGSVIYVRNDGLKVTYNKRGFPEFEPQHMHPVSAMVPNPEVWVPFDCIRDQEFAAANAMNGLAATPMNYVWHHSHEFEVHDGIVKIKMQLVKVDVHKWAKHSGGIGIGKQILGAAACK